MITIMYNEATMSEDFLYHADLPASETVSVVVAENDEQAREMQLEPYRCSPVVIVTVDKQQVIFAGKEALSYLYRA